MEIYNKKQIKQIASVINNGGIIITPTDTIYGFSCSANNTPSIKKICEIKKVDETKQFIVLVSNLQSMKEICELMPENIAFINNNCPNPITMIFNKKEGHLADYFVNSTLAVRIPKDNYLQELLKRTGPIVSTSCNLHGEKPLNEFEIIKQQFSEQVDAIIHQSQSNKHVSSTIINLTVNPNQIIRQGDYIVK